MLKYVNNELIKRIYIVGCGGTGSRLVGPVCQLVKTVKHMKGAIIYLVDADIVEEKNLARQNFIMPDVGLPKAQVLAERYSNAFDVECVAVVAMTSDPEMSKNKADWSGAANEACLVIMCVDSVKARRDTIALFSSVHSPTSILIDAGNGDVFGQVSISNFLVLDKPEPNTTVCGSHKANDVLVNLTSLAQEPKMNDVYTVGYLPLDVVRYASMVDAEGKSCTDLDQTLAVNNMMSAMILNMVQNVLYSLPIRSDIVRFNLSGISSFEELTINSYLKKLLDLRKKDDSKVYTSANLYSIPWGEMQMQNAEEVKSVAQAAISATCGWLVDRLSTHVTFLSELNDIVQKETRARSELKKFLADQKKKNKIVPPPIDAGVANPIVPGEGITWKTAEGLVEAVLADVPNVPVATHFNPVVTNFIRDFVIQPPIRIAIVG